LAEPKFDFLLSLVQELPDPTEEEDKPKKKRKKKEEEVGQEPEVKSESNAE
jgi:hypothetical protein